MFLRFLKALVNFKSSGKTDLTVFASVLAAFLEGWIFALEEVLLQITSILRSIKL
jgi:hypothetical protein